MMKLKRMAFGVPFVAAIFVAAMAVPSYAAFDYTNTFAGVQTELSTALTSIVPLVVVVFALILGIRLAFNLFRRVVK